MLNGLASMLQVTYLVGTLTVQSYICQQPSIPMITAPANNSSVTAGTSFLVSGQGPSESTVTLSVNGTDAVSLQPDESDHFSASLTVANAGDYSIGVKASRPCGSAVGTSILVTATTQTPPIQPEEPEAETPSTPSPDPTPSPKPSPEKPSVIIDTPQPDVNSDDQGTSKGMSLALTSPLDQSVTTDGFAFVSGNLSHPGTVKITVNGSEVGATLSQSKSFGVSVPLEAGDNIIVVTASSNAGTASAKLSVTRQTAAQQIPWHQTEVGEMTLRIATISAVSILLIIAIIIFILL